MRGSGVGDRDARGSAEPFQAHFRTALSVALARLGALDDIVIDDASVTEGDDRGAHEITK